MVVTTFPYHRGFLSHLVYTGWAAVWGATPPPSRLPRPPAWVGPHSGSSSTAVSGSDDWHSANGHRRRPNNSGRAPMNVLVTCGLHNIWKPRRGDLPQRPATVNICPCCAAVRATFGAFGDIKISFIFANVGDKVAAHFWSRAVLILSCQVNS